MSILMRRRFAAGWAILFWSLGDPVQADQVPAQTSPVPTEAAGLDPISVPEAHEIPATANAATHAEDPAHATLAAEPPVLERFLGLRDPFKCMILMPKGQSKSPLETFPVNTFKMIGVLTGPYQTRAILVDSTGRSHFVAVNMKIGIHEGRVIQIAPDRVRVREKIPNILGKLENNDLDIMLVPEGKLQPGPNQETKHE